MPMQTSYPGEDVVILHEDSERPIKRGGASNSRPTACKVFKSGKGLVRK